MRNIRILLATTVLCIFLAATKAQGEIFSVPRSNTLISVELTLPDGQIAQVQVRDGSMISVKDETSGYMYAFVSALDKENRQINFTPLSVSDLGGGRQRANQFEDERAFALNKVDTIPTPHGNFGFLVTELASASFSSPLLDPRSTGPSTLKKIYGKSGGGSCCVSCGAITVCGDSVGLKCGSCDGGAMKY